MIILLFVVILFCALIAPSFVGFNALIVGSVLWFILAGIYVRCCIDRSHDIELIGKVKSNKYLTSASTRDAIIGALPKMKEGFIGFVLGLAVSLCLLTSQLYIHFGANSGQSLMFSSVSAAVTLIVLCLIGDHSFKSSDKYWTAKLPSSINDLIRMLNEKGLLTKDILNDNLHIRNFYPSDVLSKQINKYATQGYKYVLSLKPITALDRSSLALIEYKSSTIQSDEILSSESLETLWNLVFIDCVDKPDYNDMLVLDTASNRYKELVEFNDALVTREMQLKAEKELADLLLIGEMKEQYAKYQQSVKECLLCLIESFANSKSGKDTFDQIETLASKNINSHYNGVLPESTIKRFITKAKPKVETILNEFVEELIAKLTYGIYQNQTFKGFDNNDDYVTLEYTVSKNYVGGQTANDSTVSICLDCSVYGYDDGVTVIEVSRQSETKTFILPSWFAAFVNNHASVTRYLSMCFGVVVPSVKKEQCEEFSELVAVLGLTVSDIKLLDFDNVFKVTMYDNRIFVYLDGILVLYTFNDHESIFDHLSDSSVLPREFPINQYLDAIFVPLRKRLSLKSIDDVNEAKCNVEQ